MVTNDLINTTLWHIYRNNSLTSKILEAVFQVHTGIVFQKNEFLLKQHSVSIITDSAIDRYHSLQKEKPQILKEAPIKYIASYLGIVGTSLSRIRKKYQKCNLFFNTLLPYGKLSLTTLK